VTVSCPFGCRPDTGGCFGTDASGSINAMWITFAVGSLFLVLGTMLGIPYGKLTGEEDMKPGFDTTIVIKYIFFFVGLFLMYLSLGMAYNNVNIYGGESHTLGGVNTTVLVIMITLILFVVVLFIETLFYILKRSFTLKEKEKWGEREE
jgi:sterol desaturase/sphingolipid hydroxylase (fatty acid hydroxylase superfamily)